jgi:hypothetical protein
MPRRPHHNSSYIRINLDIYLGTAIQPLSKIQQVFVLLIASALIIVIARPYFETAPADVNSGEYCLCA